MTTYRESIKHAEGAVWPAVRQELAELATPIAIDKLVSTKQARSNVRYVVEATIQAIAAAGLLRTPADADVIGKAVEWHEDWTDDEDGLPVDDLDEIDQKLYDAITKMLDEVDRKPRP